MGVILADEIGLGNIWQDSSVTNANTAGEWTLSTVLGPPQRTGVAPPKACFGATPIHSWQGPATFGDQVTLN